MPYKTCEITKHVELSNCVLVCVSYEQTNIIMIQEKYGWYCKRVLVYRPVEALFGPFYSSNVVWFDACLPSMGKYYSAFSMFLPKTITIERLMRLLSLWIGMLYPAQSEFSDHLRCRPLRSLNQNWSLKCIVLRILNFSSFYLRTDFIR